MIFFSFHLWMIAIIVLFFTYCKFLKNFKISYEKNDINKKLNDYTVNKLSELNNLSDSTKIIWKKGYKLLWIEIVEID